MKSEGVICEWTRGNQGGDPGHRKMRKRSLPEGVDMGREGRVRQS